VGCGQGRGSGSALTGCLQESGGDTCRWPWLSLLSIPGGLSRLGGGAAGAAAGRCSFRFANEEQGEEGRNLLRDAFSNLPYQPGRETGALAGSLARWDLAWGRR